MKGREYSVQPLFKDLSARDLLQARVTDSAGDTVQRDSPLVTAAKQGYVCVLDNLDQIRPDILSRVTHLLADGHCELPDGSLLTAKVLPDSQQNTTIHPIKDGFQVVSVASLNTRNNNVTPSWMSHNLSEMFSFVRLSKPDINEIVDILKYECQGTISEK